MTNGAGAFQFGATIATAIRSNLLTLVLMAAPLLVLLFGGRRRYRFHRRGTLAPKVALVALGIAIQLVTVWALPSFGGTDDTTAYGLYHNASDAYLGVNKLGLLTAFRLDLQRTITDEDTSGSIVLDNPIHTDPPAPSDPIPSGDPAPEGTNPDGSTKPTLNIDFYTPPSENENLSTLTTYSIARYVWGFNMNHTNAIIYGPVLALIFAVASILMYVKNTYNFLCSIFGVVSPITGLMGLLTVEFYKTGAFPYVYTVNVILNAITLVVFVVTLIIQLIALIKLIKKERAEKRAKSSFANM
jgi:hypothetical protein